MVAGHLQEKNDFYYIVLSYKDAAGKRKTKWEATGLSVKRNKKKAEALLLERRRNFMVPTAPAEIRLDDDILFSDFMLKWLEVTKSSIQITTYASYQGTGQGKFGDPLSCKHPQGVEVCGKDRPDSHQSGR